MNIEDRDKLLDLLMLHSMKNNFKHVKKNIENFINTDAHHIDDKKDMLDDMIKYFESQEEYEICAEVLSWRLKI